MRIHCFQHVSFEGLGSIADWLVANNHSISYTPFYAPVYTFPELSEIDALIIMGGPMSVYDDQAYSWLAEEKAFITAAIKAGKKILGICLGAQLIALCCGAGVHTAPYKEIGWFPVHATKEAPDWFKQLLTDSPVVFHWHGDQFDIPAGAVNLAYSEANTNQAFLIGNQVLGLQFHAEITTASLNSLVVNCWQELRPDQYIQVEDIIIHPQQPFTAANEIMAVILSNLFLSV